MSSFNLIETAFRVMKFFVPFLFALCFHEYAHGWVARLRGDRTAEMMGRLTLNPMAHADLLGTVILPIMAILTHIPFFGWAKPVPVNERNLKNPRTDMFWVASAGPLSNLLLAFVAAIATGLFAKFDAHALMTEDAGAHQILEVLQTFIMLNVYLAVFNLIPLHPLDGGKVIARFLPHEWNRKLEEMQQYTSLFLMMLFITGAISIISGPANFIARIFWGIAQGVASV
jgi:Zn-dependent protease